MDEKISTTAILERHTGMQHGNPIYAALYAGMGYYIGAMLGFALTFKPLPTSILWPPNAILLGALLLTPAARWPLILMAVFVAHMAVQLQSGIPIAMILGWFATNCSEALIGAACMRMMISAPVRFDSFRHVWSFLFSCAFLAPFVSSFLDAGLVKLIGWGEGGYWQLWRTRFFSNILAVLAFVPVMLTWNKTCLAAIRDAPPKLRRHGQIWALSLLIVCVLVFFTEYHGSNLAPLLLYAPLPILLWAAVQFNPLVVSTSFLAVALFAIVGAGHGHGPFVSDSLVERALTMQLFLIGVAVPLYLLTAAIQERRKALESLQRKQDITNRKLAEEAARMEEEVFSQIFRLSPDAMMISRDVEACILDVNNRWEKLFRFKRDDVVGKAVHELNLYASDKDRCAVLEHAARGEVRDLELQMRDTSGLILQVMLSGVAITIGKDCCFITIIRDVSELRRAEQQAQEQRAQLTHLARVALLGKLSGALAHELNQPLTAILSNAQAAQRELAKAPADLDEIRQILQDISEEDKRAGEVIRRLRALFRKEAPEMQPLDLNEVMKETLGIARADLATRKVVVETSLKPGLAMVFGDRVQLQQVFLNLILNACEAMNGNASEQHINISTDEVPGSVQLSVSDTGHGIAPNAMEHLFDAFFTTKPHGLGFGLSISLSIVVEHGGRIEAMNNPGAGATFRVSLPAYTGGNG